MESGAKESSSGKQKWQKVAYGGMQAGFDDNYTDDESFLKDMVMNANVVKRDLLKVMLDSVSISQHLCISALVVIVWVHTLRSAIDEIFLLALDACILLSGFSVFLLTATQLSFSLFSHYLLKISFFISGLYISAPIHYTLTRSISSDSIWALSATLLLVHLFLHDYSGHAVRPPPGGARKNSTLAGSISLNASIIASVLIASRLPSRLHVFAVTFFSLLVFLFAPLAALCIKEHSLKLHLGFSFSLMSVTLSIMYAMNGLLFAVFLALLVFISVVCPYWLVRIHEYKFEINGPWDEAKLCFDITE